MSQFHLVHGVIYIRIALELAAFGADTELQTVVDKEGSPLFALVYLVVFP